MKGSTEKRRFPVYVQTIAHLGVFHRARSGPDPSPLLHCFTLSKRPDHRANGGRGSTAHRLGSTMKLFALLTACTLALLLSACGSPEPGTSSLPDAGAPDSSEPDADANDPEIPDGSEPDAPNCACDAATECCDGCDPINAGEACDDGLECTLGTTCQTDGTCGAPTASPCDADLAHPECQAATCDEVAGCRVQNVREGLSCEAAGIFDGQCDGGECVGTACECDAESECCDGCNAINEGELCDGADYGTACTAGECAPAPCDDCDPGNPCCDGCYWTEGARCPEGLIVDRTCLDVDVCGGEYEQTVCHNRCQAEDNYECSSELGRTCEASVSQCGAEGVCIIRNDGNDTCSFDSTC